MTRRPRPPYLTRLPRRHRTRSYLPGILASAAGVAATAAALWWVVH